MQGEGRVLLQRERERGWIFPFKAINSCQCEGSELSWAGRDRQGDNERGEREANNSPAAGQLTRPLCRPSCNAAPLLYCLTVHSKVCSESDLITKVNITSLTTARRIIYNYIHLQVIQIQDV